MGMVSLRRVIFLMDAQSPDHKLVQADLYRDYPSAELELVEAQWADARDRLRVRDPAPGLTTIEHAHWDWRNKVQSVEAGFHMLVAVERNSRVQGMMAVARQPRHSQVTNDPIVYVDYLEAAPWNLKNFADPPRFLGVGTVLIQEAIRLSLDSGFQGRLGLHSLPQAESFYRSRCGMTALDQDPKYFDLAYFEFTAQQATEWLAATGGNG